MASGTDGGTRSDPVQSFARLSHCSNRISTNAMTCVSPISPAPRRARLMSVSSPHMLIREGVFGHLGRAPLVRELSGERDQCSLARSVARKRDQLHPDQTGNRGDVHIAPPLRLAISRAVSVPAASAPAS